MELKELREKQKWSLSQKVSHSMDVISSFVERMGGVDKVYIAFSGGKDSTVLLDIARRLYPDILAVFCMTGNEYPDICRFVREKKNNGENIEIIMPKMKPREVWAKYGFPLVGKEISRYVHDVRTNPNSEESKIRLDSNSQFSITHKWRFLINEKFCVHNVCCTKLKKDPFHIYDRKSGRKPIIGVMASESTRREKDYISNGGCNYYGSKTQKSMPLSIWLEQDIWEYIQKFNVKIADIYHKGAKRTGCMGCGFGAQFKNDNRFYLLHKLYPKAYDMVMNYTNNGVTFREALRKVLSKNGLYLPDEQPPMLFSDEDFL